MEIKTNAPLSQHTTMRIGGKAHFFAEAHTPAELATLYHNATRLNQAIYIIGGGSNLIARDEGFNGLVIANRIPGFEIIEDTPQSTTIKVGAGEIWDSIVERAVNMNLTGIEALSAIPGTAGAAPVQNIGAYGQEIADTLVSLEAYDIPAGEFVTIDAHDCEFSYRHSIFRSTEQGRYAITSITLKLSKSMPQPPFYDALQKYLDENNITDYTPTSIRLAVTAIRSNKLPDPTQLPNAGSFFKNALVEEWLVNELRANNPDMPAYQMNDGLYKIPTGWLIEQAGFKGQLLHGMRVHTKNALVLINESASSYSDLAAARDEIINAVRDTFRVSIEQEPLEI